MSRRSTPQRLLDERAFPVRLRFIVPELGLGRTADAMYAWLAENVGRGNYAVHSAGRDLPGAWDGMAVHLRRAADAAALVEAFPELTLADGTALSSYTSPMLAHRKKD